MLELVGSAASPGIAMGKIHFFNNGVRRLELHIVQDVQAELARFDAACEQAMEILRALYRTALVRVGPNESCIFEIHQLMLNDQDYSGSVRDQIKSHHYAAEYAVQQTGERLAQIFARMDDAYLRERGADLRDISNSIVRLLCGESAVDFSEAQGHMILAAEDFLPSEVIRMDGEQALAFVTRAGSKTSHSAILARTRRIPAVVGLGKQLDRLHEGMVIVDGFRGVVVFEPDEKTIGRYMQKI